MAGPDTMEISSGGGVEESKTSGEPKPQQVTNANAAMEEEESKPDPLKEALEAAEEQAQTHPAQAIAAFHAVLHTPNRDDEPAQRIKEEAIYRLAKLHADAHGFREVMALLKESNEFFALIPKAKTAKIVRTIIDIVTKVPDSVELQVELCKEVVAWCIAQKRTFLRQRIESRLASLLFLRGEYADALSLINKLLRELKKFDDKQLLVETHLIEARIDHALRNLPKAKAALTAARTAGNSIYVVPAMQAELDQMSGVLHCEEGDYKTAHSYFLEAFEAFDSLSDPRSRKCLEYMMLCSILQGAPQEVSAVTSKHGLKYAGEGMSALVAIAAAAKGRSLELFDGAREKYGGVLAGDLLMKHHIHIVYEQLLEANLLKIIEPFSCVEISHVASLINLPEKTVEKKLSQMILDNKILGTLDQGRGQLLVYEGSGLDKTYTHGLEVIGNLGTVVDSLFRRAQKMVNSGHVHARPPLPFAKSRRMSFSLSSSCFSASSTSTTSSSSSSSSTLPQGHALQSYNTELVQALGELKDKRDALSQQIRKEEEERSRLQHEAEAIAARLQRVQASLDEKMQTRNVYNRTIGDTEAAYRKILESSQTLLHVLKRESHHLLNGGSSSEGGVRQQRRQQQQQQQQQQQPKAGSSMG